MLVAKNRTKTVPIHNMTLDPSEVTSLFITALPQCVRTGYKPTSHKSPGQDRKSTPGHVNVLTNRFSALLSLQQG